MGRDTKNLIANSLLQLTEQKSIDKITVKDVVEYCHISRQTFYYYYQDLNEVMEWHAEQAFRQVLEKSINAQTEEEALHIFVTTVVEGAREVLPRLLNSRRHADIEILLYETVRGYLQEMLAAKRPNIALSLEDKEAALNFYACGISGILLESAMREQSDTDLLAEQLKRILSGSMFREKNI